MYLRRAIEMLDYLVQSRRNKRAALRLMRKLIRKYRMVVDQAMTLTRRPACVSINSCHAAAIWPR
jgi:transposase-like protein